MGEIKRIYSTALGFMNIGFFEDFLASDEGRKYFNKVQLILTSPPFPLNRKKSYGNLSGDAYIEWFSKMAILFKQLLTPTGSIVIELGNAWEKGKPTMSALPIKALLAFLDKGELNLCQQFICYNQARLPSPAQWVNVERIRVKDAFTHVWWMSVNERPKADNRRVLRNYSDSMRKLLETQKYNAGRRPSEHNIGSHSFLHDNLGSIPPNVLTYANTSSSDPYLAYCRKNNLKRHPARMSYNLADFFIKFLTDSNDLVFDPFAGSNTTGIASENLERRWISIEAIEDYAKGSLGRFLDKNGLRE